MGNSQILLLFMSMAALGAAIQITDCGSKGAQIHYVGVSPCDHDDDDACILMPAKTYEIKVAFIPIINTTNATDRISIIAWGSTYTFPDSDACEEIKCPAVAGVQQTIKANITGDASYPKPKIEFRWQVLDDNQNSFFCFVLPFKIKK